jgi:hypothetical protein
MEETVNFIDVFTNPQKIPGQLMAVQFGLPIQRACQPIRELF